MTPLSTPAKGLLLAGLLLRLAAAAVTFSDPLSPGGDDGQYRELAVNLAEGKGYSLNEKPTASRAPLYPLAMGAFYRASGLRGPGPVRILQAFWGAGVPFLAYKTAALAGGPFAGLAALALTALDPVQILLPTSLYMECFYSGLVLLVAWAAAAWRTAPDDRNLAAFGFTLGLSLACRSTLALVPALALLRLARARALLFLGACLLPVLPWTARNALVFHRLIPFETGIAGPVIYYASEGRLMAPEDEAGPEPMRTMYQTLPHEEWDGFSLRLAAANIRARPSRYLASTLRRVWLLWTDSYACYLLYYHPPFSRFMTEGWHWEWICRPCQAAFAAAALLAFCALVLKRGSPAVQAVAALLLCSNVYALGTVFARFNAPLTPLVYILAGAGAAALLERKRRAER